MYSLKYSAQENENIFDLKREGNETLKLSAEPILNEDTTPSQPLTSNHGLVIPMPMFRSTMSSDRGGVQLSVAELGKSPDTISFETDGQLEHSTPHIGDLMEDVILQEELENSGGSPYKKNTVFHGSGKTSAARGDFLQHLAVSKLTHKDKSSIYITKGTSAPSSGAHIDPGEVEDPASVSSRRVAE